MAGVSFREGNCLIPSCKRLINFKSCSETKLQCRFLHKNNAIKPCCLSTSAQSTITHKLNQYDAAKCNTWARYYSLWQLPNMKSKSDKINSRSSTSLTNQQLDEETYNTFISSQESNWGRFFWAAAFLSGVTLFSLETRRSDTNEDDAKDEFPEAVFQDPHAPIVPLLLYKGTWLTQYYFSSKKVLDDCMNFPVNKDDIIVVGFPKSGTTWVQEIVYKIKTIDNPSNEIRAPETGVELNMEEKFPLLEDFHPVVQEMKQRSSPRFMKTHLSYQLIPKNARDGSGKIIYIARNPKDVCVSFFHFVSKIKGAGYTGDMKDLFNSFLNGKISWGPWLGHVRTFWEHRNDENILFITYEQLKETGSVTFAIKYDSRSYPFLTNCVYIRDTIKKMAEFLEVPLSEDQLGKVVRSTSFESMKNNNSVNYNWWKSEGRVTDDFQFMRKGIVGDYKNHFTSEMDEEMQREFIEPLKACNLAFENSKQ